MGISGLVPEITDLNLRDKWSIYPWTLIYSRVIYIGIGTKSQQALKLQQEQVKTERKQHSRELKEAESQRQYELRQQKKKEKHRGRWFPRLNNWICLSKAAVAGTPIPTTAAFIYASSSDW